MNRRTFTRYIGTLGTAAIIMPEILLSCDLKSKNKISTSRLGADFKRGHQVRENNFFTDQSIEEDVYVDHLIVGAGISGLSCAWHLEKAGFKDYLLLEMNDKPGGNAGFENNQYSAFPLGAHYLSFPNPLNEPLILFMEEIGLVKGKTDGKLLLNEEYLCHSPEERLLYRGVFAEGLIPFYGIPQNSETEIARFLELMEQYRRMQSEDHIDLFHIPLRLCADSEFARELDQITFKEFLQEKEIVSDELLWFLDYCCRDDYGAGLDKVSAWAGIHYFAARKAQVLYSEPTDVFTWPEGNGFLVKQLNAPLKDRLKTNISVLHVKETPEGVEVLARDQSNLKMLRFKCNSLVLSCPSYVAKHLLKDHPLRKIVDLPYVHHPWMVATVILNKLPENHGVPLAWDNVRFGTKGLGYVDNRHQELNAHRDKHVFSVYYAFDKHGANEERRHLFTATDDELLAIVLQELESMHPEITKEVEHVTFQLWGHGMISPYPGTFARQREFEVQKQSFKKIRLAHTDYSGYSVFEEAFDLGWQEAQHILN